jgi:hypothetical protein
MIHPKPPALIRPRACTSLVSITQLALPSRQPALPNTDATPHLPRRSGTVPARVWLNAKTQHAFPHTDSPRTNSTQLATWHPTTAALIGLRANTMVASLTNHDGPNQDLTQHDVPCRALANPTLRHRSRDHANRAGGLHDLPQRASPNTNLPRHNLLCREPSLSASSKTHPCRPRERFFAGPDQDRTHHD